MALTTWTIAASTLRRDSTALSARGVLVLERQTSTGLAIDVPGSAMYADPPTVTVQPDGSVPALTVAEGWYRVTYKPDAEGIRGWSGLHHLTADTTWAAIADGLTADGPVEASAITQVNAARDAAVAAAASVNREQPGGVAGLDAGGLLFDSRMPTRLTDAGLKVEFSQVAHRPVNVREGYGTTDTAVRAAIADAMSGSRAVYFPKSAYAINGDVTLALDGLAISGDGEASVLNFSGGGLVLDGASAGHLLRPSLRDLTINRTGAVGPALYAKGGGPGSGVARLTASNLHVTSAGGDALLYEGSYIGAFTGCYFRNSQYGLRTLVNSLVGVNLLSFFGGEFQGNTYGVSLTKPAGVNFFGVGVEGNSGGGLLITDYAQCVGVYGGYFEGNGAYDIKISTQPNSSGGFPIYGSVFYDGSAAKAESIRLERAVGVDIRSCLWSTMSAGGSAAIRIAEIAAGQVRGQADPATLTRIDGGTVIDYGTNTEFNRTTIGRGGTTLKSHLAGGAVLDFPSIAAGASSTLTITVAGAAVGDDVTLHSNSLAEGGIRLDCAVTATDTVSVRATNTTTAAIDPAARTFRVRIWR